jgi:sec-independent protein translocase protein TatA
MPMGSFHIWHWLVVLAVVLLLFGGSGRIATLMGDLAEGIRTFRNDRRERPDAPPRPLFRDAWFPPAETRRPRVPTLWLWLIAAALAGLLAAGVFDELGRWLRNGLR